MLVTPEGVDDAHLVRVIDAGAAALGDALMVQARAKSTPAALVRVAHLVARAARRARVPFAVNGDLALARELGADAFHAPSDLPLDGLRESMQTAWISCAAHDGAAVRAAASAGLSAVLVSPIFGVPNKGPARGLGALREARSLAPSLGVVALGGLTPERAGRCLRAGADGVAVMRAAFAAPDPRALFEGFAVAFASQDRLPGARASAMATYDETLPVTIQLLRRHVDAARVVSPTEDIQGDLGLDSLAVMELVADAEERFDISLPNEMLSELRTVGDVARAIAKLTSR